MLLINVMTRAHWILVECAFSLLLKYLWSSHSFLPTFFYFYYCISIFCVWVLVKYFAGGGLHAQTSSISLRSLLCVAMCAHAENSVIILWQKKTITFYVFFFSLSLFCVVYSPLSLLLFVFIDQGKKCIKYL